MSILRLFKKILDTLLVIGAITSLICMVITVIIQVFARFCLPQAPAWTEEASRIFFIYISTFAGGLAFERKAFVSLGIIDHYFKGVWLFGIRLIVNIVSAFLVLLIAYVSFEFVEFGQMETSPTLRFLTMNYVFASITIMMGMIGIYVVIDILCMIKYRLTQKESA